MKHTLLPQLEDILKEKIIFSSSTTGGCISTTQIIQTISEKKYFLKSNSPSNLFLCEANGLKEIAKTNQIRVPEVLYVTQDFILMEYIPATRAKDTFFTIFGIKLAKMHTYSAPNFGFYENNYIGATPQLNTFQNNWDSFYHTNRLLSQYKLAEKNGYLHTTFRDKFLKLERKLTSILKGSEESPALLHGDLWNGNFICDESNQPVLIDPAVYYGHREAEMAMTKLFGGYPNEFYQAYQNEYPLKEGWRYRENIYKLYHILNHLNLFGIGYLREAEMLIDYYL